MNILKAGYIQICVTSSHFGDRLQGYQCSSCLQEWSNQSDPVLEGATAELKVGASSKSKGDAKPALTEPDVPKAVEVALKPKTATKPSFDDA